MFASLASLRSGRLNWLIAENQRDGAACATITSRSEAINELGHHPLGYRTAVLEHLSTTANRDIESLLPINWRAV